ncbi:MAG TPA: NAD(P)/FAD-dependent oxidoreductase [Chthoniobacteraceae bacterium]|jgi:flavin-dependent dehydrogenase|nr:NAD(P)/FAD-dependent oxidoreductase [Chthoniobacteraceae bacterium]
MTNIRHAMTYDVVIIGGSLSGAAAATLLRRERPELRILIVERAPQFTRRVGEATVEVSGYFLGRVLGLMQHLNDQHLVKQGMRFFFANEATTSLADSSEIGPKFNVRLPAWQIDRSVVDEELLRRAAVGETHLRRPAQVTGVKLTPGGEQVVTIRENGATEDIRCRWAVDASGVAALVSRQEGWWQPNTEHPTAAAWGRLRGVKDWDGRELAERHPEWAARCFGARNTATNHLVGDGWWSWWIPLKGGDVSVGVVFDQRLVQFPKGDAPLSARITEFLSRHPVARELLADAEWVEGDTHWRKNLAYSSSQYAGDGCVLVGDAAAFLDPLYSPGMDWLSFTVSSAVKLIVAQQSGEELAPLLAAHNATFSRSYRRWFEAIYQDKYEYLGEYDLMRTAFRMDLGLYYLGIVSQPLKMGPKALLIPPFAPAVSAPVFYFIRTYNRRIAAIARSRRARGVLGRQNSHHHFLFPSFSTSPQDIPSILTTACRWLGLELREGWRSWFIRSKKAPAPTRPLPATIPVPEVSRVG